MGIVNTLVSTLFRLLTCLLLLLVTPWAAAGVHIENASFGIFTETGPTALSLEQARVLNKQKKFEPTSYTDLTFGIGHRPVWIHLRVVNDGANEQEMRMRVGTTWTDFLDLYRIAPDGSVSSWKAGDHYAGAINAVPGVGTVFPVVFPVGVSEVFVRAQTVDPMVLPIDLVTPAESLTRNMKSNIVYGLLYGFLIALIAYNLLFYIVLHRRRYLDYSLYVMSFVVMNIGYTGQGMSWIWDDYPGFQNYFILVMMVLYSITGLSFATSFLELRDGLPRIFRAVRLYQWFGFVAVVIPVLFQLQTTLGFVAFGYLTGMAMFMLYLGVISWNRMQEGHYFLTAAIFGMLGAMSTGLTVWSVLPYTTLAYHGAEIGVVIEAAVLAAALAKQMRTREAERIKAEYLAAYDSLTSLRNRRALYAESVRYWRDSVSRELPLCILMADVDHFKIVNDTYGHTVGDRALIEIAKVFQKSLRLADIVARWGGEEFIVVLPGTDIKDAIMLSERIRETIEKTPIKSDGKHIYLTVSFGVAERREEESLDKLVDRADRALLEAKQNGRNRVKSAED